MNLLAIRDLNQQDPLGQLGKPVPPTPPKPPLGKPAYREVRPGIIQGPNGKLETVFPKNEEAKLDYAYQQIGDARCKALCRSMAETANRFREQFLPQHFDAWISWDNSEAYPDLPWTEAKLQSGKVVTRGDRPEICWALEVYSRDPVVAWR